MARAAHTAAIQRVNRRRSEGFGVRPSSAALLRDAPDRHLISSDLVMGFLDGYGAYGGARIR
jgi:hypothetical protein